MDSIRNLWNYVEYVESTWNLWGSVKYTKNCQSSFHLRYSKVCSPAGETIRINSLWSLHSLKRRRIRLLPCIPDEVLVYDGRMFLVVDVIVTHDVTIHRMLLVKSCTNTISTMLSCDPPSSLTFQLFLPCNNATIEHGEGLRQQIYHRKVLEEITSIL